MKEPKKWHFGQIPTSYRVINDVLFDSGYRAIHILLKALSHTGDEELYKNCVVAAAAYFAHISKLIYCGVGGQYKKLSETKYRKGLFEAWVETAEEVYDRSNCYGITMEQAEYIHKSLCQIADLICPMLACVGEVFFIGEFAYAIDYVVQHKGKLEKPEIKTLFPVNYDDFHASEGIGKELFDFIYA